MTQFAELQTLPNIDINIKCGNSLISRFGLDTDLKQALKKSKWTIDAYRVAVDTYRNAENKEQKREMERLIADIKSDFRSEISLNDPKLNKYRKLSGELFLMTNQQQLFEMSKKEKAIWNKKLEELTKDSKKLEAEIEEIKSNKIYENAFEWRFEFPEVLNDNGDFVGFDVVVGNPPYGMLQNDVDYFLNHYKTTEGRFDLYEAFIERGLILSKHKAILKYILPNTLLSNLYSQKVRKNLIENYNIIELTNFGMDVFEEATVHTCIIGVQNSINKGLVQIRKQIWDKDELKIEAEEVDLDNLIDKSTSAINITLTNSEVNLFAKLSKEKSLSEICYIRQCIKTGDDKKYVLKSETNLEEPWKKSLRGKGIERYGIIEDDLYIKYGDFLARNWQNKSFYETSKIAVRETGNRIIAALDVENRYFLSTLYSIYPKSDLKISYLKFLLGILNSKSATFFIKRIAFDLTEGAFTKVRTNQLGRLPIASYNEELVDKVDKILMLKTTSSDTIDLEVQIDQLVYELYGLTEEEIKIVEGE